MARYILVYEIEDYADNGGGIKVEFFKADKEHEMHKRVNELSEERLKIICAGFLQKEFEYKPVSYVKEYKPQPKLD